MRHSLLTNGKLKELREINKARRAVGLPEIKMGTRECLRCCKEYFSEDLKNQHLCTSCREESHIQQLTKKESEL